MTPTVTPQAFVRSLKDRAANAAKIVGVPAAELVDRYYHRRLLARVFEAEPDSWVLKGGQALLVRWPQARYSVDVDLLRTSKDATVDSAVDALVAAASVDLDDHLTFSHYDTDGETTGHPTRKVRFEVRFGLRRLTMVSVDVVVTDHAPLGKLVDKRLEAPFIVEASRGRQSACGRWKTTSPTRSRPCTSDIAQRCCRRLGSRISSISW